jgi:PncC family amidohydrolase
MAEAALVALAARLQERCLARRLTVGTAESCTGGLVAATITAIPGSSGYFLGGIVSYADEVKASILGVPRAMLEAHGAVSEQVADAMAAGCRRRLGVDLAISITGIAGPDGGSEAKPVGLVYLGLTSGSGVDTRRFQFPGDRREVRLAAATAAIEWLTEAAS